MLPQVPKYNGLKWPFTHSTVSYISLTFIPGQKFYIENELIIVGFGPTVKG